MILIYKTDGKFVSVCKTRKEAAKKTKVDLGNLSKVLLGRLNMSNGYTFIEIGSSDVAAFSLSEDTKNKIGEIVKIFFEDRTTRFLDYFESNFSIKKGAK
jgi:hypothetical protein